MRKRKERQKKMTTHNFSITQDQLNSLLTLYPNTGKNSDVGKLAVEIAKLYFLSLNDTTIFTTNKNGIDLSTTINDTIEHYEIKGTADKNVSWNKLKVSSQNCHDHLVSGMTLIRITNIGMTELTLHFLKHNEDFELVPEPRWSVIRKK
jgi:hypothetical protein